MSAGNARPGGRAAPSAAAPRAALLCAAPGCPWAGSAGETGRFLCIAHWGHEGAQWASITDRTTELEWFATFITDVQRMHNFPRKGEQPWQAYAAQFWANTDPTMQPTPDEIRRPGVYLYRLFGELRAMALGKDRPQPHVPQDRWPTFAPSGKTEPAAAAPPAPAAPPPAPVQPRPAPIRQAAETDVPAWVLDDIPPADDVEFPAANAIEEA